MTKIKDLTGIRFGKLLVLRDSGERTKAGKARFICLCDCGVEKSIIGGNLNNGLVNSCGCEKDKKTSERFKKHGFSKHPMFNRYLGMISRCYDKEASEYHNYGARGIKVCDRWRLSVSDFINDIGAQPTESHTMDRIDNDGDYCPSNIRWATKKEQSINRRVTRMFTFNGIQMCAADWARSLGMTKVAVLNRIRSGWPLELALTTPAIKRGFHKRGEIWQKSGGIRKDRVLQ